MTALPPLPLPTLRPGSMGPSVGAVQAHLVAAGYTVALDGSYGPRTAEALRAFQRSAGLTQDGVYGPQTAEALRARTDTGPHPQPMPPLLRGGLWVDTVPPHRAGSARGILDWDGWARGLLATGCTDFSIAAFGGKGARYDSAFWDGRRFALAVQALKGHGGAGVTVGALVWLERATYRQGAKVWAQEAKDAAAQGYPLDYIELDAEEGWATATHAEAEAVVHAICGSVPELRVTAVPHSGRTMRCSERYLLDVISKRHMVRFAPQIYSAYVPSKEWTHAQSFRPGVFQEICGAHYLPALRDRYGTSVEVHYGTALYGQRHPAPWPLGIEALDEALGEALEDVAIWHRTPGPAPLRFWSAAALDDEKRAWLRSKLGASHE